MTITDVYDVSDDLVKKLNDWKLIGIISGKFNELKENYAKVNFVERALIDFKYIEKILLNVKLREEKCNKKSSEFRMLGNEQFSLKNRKYFQALELYNKSVCYSEPGSENIAIGYANRSAVLFEWKRYRECLANIELARKANYPARLMHKLDKREKDCRELIATQDADVEPVDFKMSFEKHPQNPNVADCLEMRRTDDEGRYICTTRALAVGDLVAIEDPFCSTLLPPMRYIRCANCKEENYLTLIPCEHCCSVMFCSEACRERAMSSFHKYECPIIDFLHKMFNKIHGIALRVCLTALELFPTIEELIAFCVAPENQCQSAFDLDYTNFTQREHYRAIHGLVSNQHLRTVSDLFQRSVVCAVLKHFIIEYTPLKEFLGGDEGKSFFTQLLFRHLQTSPSNMHGIDLVEQVNETKDDQTHSSGAYAFLSLLNHSCAPNTLRIYKGTRAYLFILRPIPAGDVLYDNYGPHFAVYSKAQRIETLSMQYRFTCKCEACENDYPFYGNIPAKKFVPYINGEIDMKSLVRYDFKYALENYERYCHFLQQYGFEYPCDQISSCEECLKMVLHILVDAVPLKAKMYQQQMQQLQQLQQQLQVEKELMQDVKDALATLRTTAVTTSESDAATTTAPITTTITTSTSTSTKTTSNSVQSGDCARGASEEAGVSVSSSAVSHCSKSKRSVNANATNKTNNAAANNINTNTNANSQSNKTSNNNNNNKTSNSNKATTAAKTMTAKANKSKA